MASFFEKLKKGMSIEEPIEEPEESEESDLSSPPFATARIIEAKTSKKPKKSPQKPPRDYTKQVKKLEIQIETPEEKEKIGEQVKKEIPKESKKEKEKKWLSFDETEEGQLTIDVYQTENDLVIQSAIAGIKPENLDISIEKDIIIIKGKREKPLEENGDYFTQECFFGPFSREIIMPAEVDSARATAEMKNGILTIRIPKVLKEKKRKITVRE